MPSPVWASDTEGIKLFWRVQVPYPDRPVPYRQVAEVCCPKDLRYAASWFSVRGLSVKELPVEVFSEEPACRGAVKKAGLQNPVLTNSKYIERHNRAGKQAPLCKALGQ